MKARVVALMVGIVLTALTFSVVLMERSRTAPPIARRAHEKVPVKILPPPSRPESVPREAFAHEASEMQASEPLAPAPLAQPSALSGLTDAHPGAALAGSLPGFMGTRSSLFSRGAATVDRPARPMSRPPPTYPPDAIRNRTSGFVRVRLEVDSTGGVVDVAVVEASPTGVFEEVAVQAARRYRFEPAQIDGEAVRSVIEQRIVFEFE